MAMDIVDEVPTRTKRKRYNKNKKKAWRKTINLRDLENALEQKRREERFGGPLEERPSQDILYLDTGEENNNEKQSEKSIFHHAQVEYEVDEDKKVGDKGATERAVASTLKKRLTSRKKVKRLRCHQLLDGLPGAKAPVKKINRVRTVDERMNPVAKEKKQKKLADPKTVARLKRRAVQSREHKEAKEKQPKSGLTDLATYDLWSDERPAMGNPVVQSYTQEMVEYYERQTKRKLPAPPSHMTQKPSALPAVELPEAGASYNPSYDDHQALLGKAVDQEEGRLKDIARDERRTTLMFPTKENAPTEETWLQEMSEGLPTAQPEEEEMEEEEEEEEEEGSSNAQKEVETEGTITISHGASGERKTQKQRRKEKERRKSELLKSMAKKMKIRESNVYKIRTYNREMEFTKMITKERMKIRAEKKEEKTKKPAKLSKYKYEEEDVPVALGDELVGSLREVKPTGCLLEDRYKSFQRRNIIETRIKQKFVRKYKQKKAVKKEHKLNWDQDLTV
ncbi:ribosome biogenesis protein NOP53 isoform X2 [Oratosquilla oratoria]|uniref:ribosome biogenesis protein NOP53 isoform X2 n=1 Tax=Oratosquilla oratoria TaxID=337810 RepID=UPI003F75A928